MSKGSKIFTILSIVLILSVMTGVIVWLSMQLYKEQDRAEAARLQVQTACESAMYDSLDNLTEMENNLAKLLASDSESANIVTASEIYKSASTAVEAVSRLPVSPEKYEDLRKFLNQVGDFAACYVRALSEGADSAKYEQQVESVFNATVNVRKMVAKSIDGVSNGDYSILDAIDADGFIDISNEMTVEYPSIIYDGPFSDSTESKVWKTAIDAVEITEEEAMGLAKDRLGMEESKVIGITGGDAEVYQITGKVNGCEAYVSIMKAGGLIVSADICSKGGMIVLTEEQAMEKATTYANNLGYDELSPIWYNAYEGVATINFTPMAGGAVLYPDLVKIKVDLASGELKGVEAVSYCTNHAERNLLPPRMTPAAAESCVSDKLTVKSTRLAVIPDNSEEILCYEVACSMNGLDYFVYINAVDGTQEDILRVIDDEQGKLVI